MGVFSRLSDIINANLNALLEKAEDPEKIIRLMIQEMEDTLVEVRSSAAKCIAEKKERQRLITRLEQEQLAWERKAELALQKGREDLARAALAEKTAIDDRTKLVGEELGQLEEQLQKYNVDIGKLQAKLSDARNRQRSIVMRHKNAQTQLKARKQIHDDRIEEMLHRFDTAERRIESIESESEALEMGREQVTLSEQIEKLEQDERVDEALAALRERVSKSDKAS